MGFVDERVVVKTKRRGGCPLKKVSGCGVRKRPWLLAVLPLPQQREELVPREPTLLQDGEQRPSGQLVMEGHYRLKVPLLETDVAARLLAGGRLLAAAGGAAPTPLGGPAGGGTSPHIVEQSEFFQPSRGPRTGLVEPTGC